MKISDGLFRQGPRLASSPSRVTPMWISFATAGSLCGVLFTAVTAGAMGGGGNPAAVMIRAEVEEAQRPSASDVSRPESRPRSRAVQTTEAAAGHYGLAVCVRLCDGYFFPSNTASGNDQTCEAQCPDAQTALYREALGSDRIEDAVSTAGVPYSQLPQAGHHRDSFDNACTCHRHNVNYSAMLLHDPTLQKGDVVMTPSGPVVYEGGQTASPRREDFVALAKDSSLPQDVRATLSTMRSAPWETPAAAEHVVSR